MRITIRDGEKFYRAIVSPQWAARNDNGALVSCGLSVPESLRPAQLRALIARKQAQEITREDWNHSGCQSRCVRRGDPTCQW
jgi:hypothetical protein